MGMTKSFNGLIAIFFITTIFIPLFLASVALAKPLGPNPRTNWPSGTIWGTNLHLENSPYIGESWYGVGSSERGLTYPANQPTGLAVVPVDNSDAGYFLWVKAQVSEPQSYSWEIKMYRIETSNPDGGTISSVMENADTLFVPQDFSVVLDNVANGVFVNLRRDNGHITGLATPQYAALNVDNAVNVIISPSSRTGNPGDTVISTVTVNNTGRYDDNYLLTVDGGGTISPSSLSINAGSTALATLTVTVGANSRVVTLRADGVYASDSASFTVNGPAGQYVLTTSVDPTNSGSVTLDPAGGTYTSGTVVTATANPATGYEFDHWSGAATGTATNVTVTMDSDKNIVAHFRSTEQTYVLTTSVNPTSGGSVTLNPAGGTYTSGTVVTATANPASGYEFDHWSGGASGTATSVTITMNSAENIVANFRNTGGGSNGGLPWAWIGLGIVIVIIIIAGVAATRGRHGPVLASDSA